MFKTTQIVLLFCLIVCNLRAFAVQVVDYRNVRTYVETSDSIAADFAKKLEYLRIGAKDTRGREDDDASFSPYIFRLLCPNIYYPAPVREAFVIDYDLSHQKKVASQSEGTAYRDKLLSNMNGRLLSHYMTFPKELAFYGGQIDSEHLIEEAPDLSLELTDLNPIFNTIPEPPTVKDIIGHVNFSLDIPRPNFWKFDGKFGAQLTQNYLSENWHKGGNSNNTFMSTLNFYLNYNDERLVQWENKLEMKLGFVTSTDDSIHNFLTNNDRIFLFTKLGVKAWHDFYYTVQGEAVSQFLPGYKANDTKAYSRFLAPLDVYVSVGVDYKPKLKNDNKLSVAMLPFTYKYRYIDSDEESILKAFRMPEGKSHTDDFGSKVEFNCNFKILKNLMWKSRFYYFTTYKYVEAEFENSFSFAFNRYFSTELYALWRFDDNRDKKYWDDKLGFFQFKEYLTVGLSYAF